jgi:S-adenosylmethionine synthetase
VTNKKIKDVIMEEVIKASLPAKMMDKKTKFYINPTGRFVIGGPMGDSGVTGRKIIVDTYGGMGRHGGGAFSGKDPSKVDRSAAYMGRYIAKNVVAAGLATRCEVQVSLRHRRRRAGQRAGRDVRHREGIDEGKISRAVREVFGLKPREIIEHLDLLKPIYQRTAAYGHFGRAGVQLGEDGQEGRAARRAWPEEGGLNARGQVDRQAWFFAFDARGVARHQEARPAGRRPATSAQPHAQPAGS